MARRGASDDLVEELGAGLVVGACIIAVVLAVILLWMTIKALELVVRVMLAHPRNKPMWVSISIFVFFVLVTLVTQGQDAVVNALAFLAGASALLTAKAVEMYYNELFQKHLDKDALVKEVLHEPWWQLDAA